jgi:hypothetical protein
MTDDLAPPVFRPGDLVQLQYGDVAIVSSASDNSIVLVAEGGSQLTVAISEILRSLQSQAFVHDRSRRKIRLFDTIMFRNSAHKVVAMYNDQVFLTAPDGQMTCSPASKITSDSGTSPSLLGKTVQKILPKIQDYSAPFEIVEVSRKGYLRGQQPGEKGLEKFKFVDHQKMWLFSDEISGGPPITS